MINEKYKIKQEVTYSDIDATFNIHPSTKDLILSKDVQAVTRSVRNLVLTNHYERPFHPEIGGNIRKMLFEQNTALTSNFIEKEIYNVIESFEPRVKLVSVDVNSDLDNNYLVATVSFYLINSVELTKIQIPFQRNIIL